MAQWDIPWPEFKTAPHVTETWTRKSAQQLSEPSGFQIHLVSICEFKKKKLTL